MADNLTHLHLHTEFSYLDGFSKVWDTPSKEPGDLIVRLKELEQKYCAITDHGSTSGWARFDKAMKKNGMVPIFGVEGYYCNDNTIKGADETIKLEVTRGCVTAKEKKDAVKKYELKHGLGRRAHFTCWAMNEEGIYEILRTQSIAGTVGFYHKPRWDLNLLREMKNCMFGTACAGGIINYWLNQANAIAKEGTPKSKVMDYARKKAIQELSVWKEILGDRLYVELQPIDWKMQAIYNMFDYSIAQELELECYLANDSHYVYPQDWEVHDILLAIQSSFGIPGADALNSPNRLRYDMHDLYVKSRQEMFDSFYKQNDYCIFSHKVVNHMLDNTMVIAERCGHSLIKKKMIMPNIKVPEGMNTKQYLIHLVKVGWKNKILPYVEKEKLPEYKDRIKYELEEITRQGFTPYFLLVYRLMKWVDKQNIARGPARGSSAGSLVAYLLNITMVDPIPFRLLFSRFIDPNRTDFPDIDMDFEDIRRREIVQYFVETYGRDNVAILGNNMTFKPKMALKDVARLYGVNMRDTQELCNLVVTRSGADSRLSFCLEDTFKQFDFAKEYTRKYPKVAQFAGMLEGRVKCVSGYTKVKTRKHGEIAINKLYTQITWKRGRGLKIRVWDGTRFVYRKVKTIFWNGEMKLYKMIADDYEIECTDEHRFLTKDGYKELRDIKVGEYVACNGLYVKNQVPWNKGVKGCQIAWNKGLNKNTSESVRKQSVQMVGNTNGAMRVKSSADVLYTWKKRVFEALLNKCSICGAKEDLIAHHILPKECGGKHTISNAQIMCRPCHSKHHKYWEKSPHTSNILVIQWVKVFSIKATCVDQVYDIEIDTDKEVERNYVANGFVTHNSVGVHAAGVVIADGDIRKYTALRKDKRQQDFLVATIDKHDAEDIGLLKMDVLGLNTMALLQRVKTLVNKIHNVKVDLEELCRDVAYKGGDSKVYKEFELGHTVGIFQFNSPGLTRLSTQVKIDKFTEISDCTALHRPGPIHSGAMAMYPGIKHGTIKKYNPLHSVVAEETDYTHGLVIYQEQVMQIVRRLGDFTWGQTNEIRKVMSKSGGAEYFMTHFWPPFKEGCAKKGIEEKTALRIFKRIMSFGSWAFNLCITGDTIIQNTNVNKYSMQFPTIAELFQNDCYAPNKFGKKSSKYLKMNTLCMCSDGRLRPNRIKSIFHKGKQIVFKITTDTGRTIKMTGKHRLMGIVNGEDTFIKCDDISVGTKLYVGGGYEKTIYKTSGVGKGWAKHQVGHLSDKRKPYIDGRSYEVTDFQNKMANMPCQRCGVAFCDELSFEAHHKERNPPYSLLRWLCNSCHKIEDWELGNRKAVWTKGQPTNIEIVTEKIEFGIEDVYDIEMQDSSRPTFWANGFVSHNSHSVSYGLVSYMCMWFKTHYPIEFCTAYLNTVSDEDDISKMVSEIHRLGIELREPDVNYSKGEYTIHDGKIVASLANVKNVGDKAVAAIVQCQPFSSFIDFVKKANSRTCNKRAVENLIKAGAFSSFKYDDEKLLENLEMVMKYLKKGTDKGIAEARGILQTCLRMGAVPVDSQAIAEMRTSVTPIYVGKHISRYYDKEVALLGKHIKVTKLVDIELDESQQTTVKKQMDKLDVWLIGKMGKPDLKRLSQETKEVIDSGQEQRYALANLEDDTDYLVLSFRQGAYLRYEQDLFNMKDKVMLVHGTVNKGWKKCYVDQIFYMDEVRKYLAGSLPYNFEMDYLVRHPVNRIFDKFGGMDAMREKYGCQKLCTLNEIEFGNSMWCLGIITNIQRQVSRNPNSKIFGKEWFWVFFEDETFIGSFMIFPTDKRFEEMKTDLLVLHEKHLPFLIKIQRDMKYTPDKVGMKMVTMSIDKRFDWSGMIKMPFKVKQK